MDIAARDSQLTRIVKTHSLRFSPSTGTNTEEVRVYQKGGLLGRIVIGKEAGDCIETITAYPEGIAPVIWFIHDCLTQYRSAYAGCFPRKEDRKLYVLYDAEVSANLEKKKKVRKKSR